ncbi:uncharacterized protein LOC130963649 [Arachis stenosperma]|uniref:uncharacterized protein LOC130963649 n=1 Tax=Arachis stenosperma TaxID=217475 RepID=UPI0025ABE8E0|nr:uncharacterized protein LOC130963649 [Arachis stenosperma]
MGGKCPHRSVKKRRYSHKTARRTKFLIKGDDMVYDQLNKADEERPLPVDEDLPGMGQYYCLHCESVTNSIILAFFMLFNVFHFKVCNFVYFIIWGRIASRTLRYQIDGKVNKKLLCCSSICFFCTTLALKCSVLFCSFILSGVDCLCSVKQMMGPAPHTQLDAELAAGMGMPDNGPKLMSM